MLDFDLNNISSCDNISDEMLAALHEGMVRQINTKLKRERILSQYDIKQLQTGKEAGTWFYCKVNGKKIQANDRKTLEDKLIALSQKNATTFRVVFEESEAYTLSRIKNEDKLISAQNTSGAHEKSFNRFCKGSIADVDICSITKEELVSFLDSVIASGVKKKAFNNLRVVLNKTFSFAIKKAYISLNPMDTIFWDEYKDCFEAPAPIKMRGFSKEEIHRLHLFAREQQEKHREQIKWWSYEFEILTGLRRGEVPPIEWTDVKKTHIDICKELVGSRKPYTIKQSTKTGKDRAFPITDQLLDFLKRLHENNKVYHPGSNYLFPDEEEALGCITHNLTYRAHSYACRKLDIAIDSYYRKGPHAFRRSHETAFMENGGTLDMAGHVYGNSPRVIKSNYMLSVEALKSREIVQAIHNDLFGDNTPIADNDLLFGT